MRSSAANPAGVQPDYKTTTRILWTLTNYLENHNECSMIIILFPECNADKTKATVASGMQKCSFPLN